jgi:C-terminal processing protease CtpA/Prc
LLNETVDGGSFVSQRWSAAHDCAPNLTELKAVAPYYSIKNGRIEGVGVKPNIEVDAADALNVALQRL